MIRQGDVGDFFYVLDTGHCDINVEGVGKVMDVGPGGSFGELALMYDAPRAATVTATEPSTTWALDQLTFKKTIMDATMKKRQYVPVPSLRERLWICCFGCVTAACCL